MPGQQELNPEERQLERALGRLRPAGHGLTRDRLMFLAGAQSNAGRIRRWQSAAGLMGLATVALGWLSLGTLPPRPPATMAETGLEAGRLAQTGVSGAVEPARLAETLEVRPWWTAQFFELRGRLVQQGVDALPTPPYAAPSPDVGRSVADWLRLLRADVGIEWRRESGGPNIVGERS